MAKTMEHQASIHRQQMREREVSHTVGCICSNTDDRNLCASIGQYLNSSHHTLSHGLGEPILRAQESL